MGTPVPHVIADFQMCYYVDIGVFESQSAAAGMAFMLQGQTL